MNQHIQQIAERLRGLRDALDLTSADIAAACGIPEEQYLAIESGEHDIPVSLLHTVSQQYGIDLSTLMFGDETYMSSYYLTRAGKGPYVERVKAYRYQALASGFKGRRVTPFLVTVEPHEADAPLMLNTHEGQEFNLVLSGRMLLQLGEKQITLEEGDSIYFNSLLPHGMKALDGTPVRFLAVII
jgi:transcriptional regulator with XRE-family HTH domain